MIVHKNRYTLIEPELQEKINDLESYFTPIELNYAFHKKKLTAIKKINFILANASRRALQDCEFEKLLLCSLTLVYYFGMRLRLSTLASRYWHWCGKKHFQKAEVVFQKTMDALQPERSEVTIKCTLNFFSKVDLWPFENFVGQILEVVLFFSRGKTLLFNLMLTDIHCTLFTDVKSARHRMRVLYEMLKSENWILDMHIILPFVTRLLDFFANSITKDNKMSAYGYLRKGFEVCLRRIFERVENQHRVSVIATMLNWFSIVDINDDDVMEFSSILDYAAELYKVDKYNVCLKEGLIKHVVCNLVGSPKPMWSLVGCRLLVRFFDRQHNVSYLSVPTIYYEFLQVRLKCGKCDAGDKLFIRQHRSKLHEFILNAAKNHCANSINLKALFSVVCCIVLEVPCNLTAAAISCAIMAIQDFALNGENLMTISRYWMHAIVVSVMSLICWVHKSPVLYTYVNKIIARRAKEAPQLNPPLKHSYNLGYHHITWNKPTLFFEDWELRYALWKHFQHNSISTEYEYSEKWNKKIPSMEIGS